MRQVILTVASRSQAPAVVDAWELEDSYYTGMSESIAGAINTKARRYPYIASSEAKADSMKVVLTVNVPIEPTLDVVYLDPRADAGLPHTRGLRGIALPVFLLWEPNEKTIQHEIIHLSQKQFPRRWWAWYARVWNFRRATEKEFMGIPERWRARRRVNPDTLGSPYTVWNDRWIPLSVFISETDPDLRNCKRGFWDLTMSQWIWDPPPGWIFTFGEGFNDEHPNEIAAHWIDGSAGYIKQDYFRLVPV